MVYNDVFGPLSIRCTKMRHIKNIVILDDPSPRCVTLAKQYKINLISLDEVKVLGKISY
jgi:hypothetical protein